MQRIVIVGTTGSGKTTLARTLAQRLHLNHIELDALHWLADWQMETPELFRQKVSEAVTDELWVADGNYSSVRDITWGRATTLIWLDYPLWRSQWQLFWRTIRRVWSRELLWGTNRERFWTQFMSRESLFLWALKSRRKHLRNYLILFQQPEYAHLQLIRLHSPHETALWLTKLSPESSSDPAAHTMSAQAAPWIAPENN